MCIVKNKNVTYTGLLIIKSGKCNYLIIVSINFKCRLEMGSQI